MANFEKALNFILENEDSNNPKNYYVNDPDDKGKETYRGISRRYHSDWAGWDFIDKYKNCDNFPLCLTYIQELEGLIIDFYKIKYWIKIMGDEIKDQRLAEKLLDMAVLFGFHAAIVLMQKAICEVISNYSNKKPFILSIDGKMGSYTLGAINNLDFDDLLFEFKAKCVRYCKKIDNPKYEKGWIMRIMK